MPAAAAAESEDGRFPAAHRAGNLEHPQGSFHLPVVRLCAGRRAGHGRAGEAPVALVRHRQNQVGAVGSGNRRAPATLFLRGAADRPRAAPPGRHARCDRLVPHLDAGDGCRLHQRDLRVDGSDHHRVPSHHGGHHLDRRGPRHQLSGGPRVAARGSVTRIRCSERRAARRWFAGRPRSSSRPLASPGRGPRASSRASRLAPRAGFGSPTGPNRGRPAHGRTDLPLRVPPTPRRDQLLAGAGHRPVGGHRRGRASSAVRASADERLPLDARHAVHRHPHLYVRLRLDSGGRGAGHERTEPWGSAGLPAGRARHQHEQHRRAHAVPWGAHRRHLPCLDCCLRVAGRPDAQLDLPHMGSRPARNLRCSHRVRSGMAQDRRRTRPGRGASGQHPPHPRAGRMDLAARSPGGRDGSAVVGAPRCSRRRRGRRRDVLGQRAVHGTSRRSRAGPALRADRRARARTRLALQPALAVRLVPRDPQGSRAAHRIQPRRARAGRDGRDPAQPDRLGTGRGRNRSGQHLVPERGVARRVVAADRRRSAHRLALGGPVSHRRMRSPTRSTSPSPMSSCAVRAWQRSAA